MNAKVAFQAETSHKGFEAGWTGKSLRKGFYEMKTTNEYNHSHLTAGCFRLTQWIDRNGYSLLSFGELFPPNFEGHTFGEFQKTYKLLKY